MIYMYMYAYVSITRMYMYVILVLGTCCFFQTAGVSISVKAVPIPESEDIVVSGPCSRQPC